MSDRRQDLAAQDEWARRLARAAFDRPLVIEAGAGTGKTTVLVTRIAAWCLGPGWERAERELAGALVDAVARRVARGVVAITFTEAAAAEMATRLADALRDVEAGELPDWLPEDALPPDPSLRARRARAVRGALDHLRVQTIHAFCRRLLVTHPLHAGLHPRLEVDAEGALREEVVRDVLEEALPRVLAEPDSAALRLAARGFGPAELERSLLALLDEGVAAADLDADPFARERLAGLHARTRAALDAFLAAAAGLAALGERSKARQVLEALERVRAQLAEAPWRDAAALGAFAELCRSEWDEDTSLGERLADWARGRLTRGERKAVGGASTPWPSAAGPRGLHRAERAASGDVAAPGASAALGAAAEHLAPLLDHLCRLDPLRLELARCVLRELLAEVEARLRARGVATFPQLLRGARDLLRRCPEVAARERAGIDQLLVDEFQDTDRTQCEVLRALALGGAAEERPGLFLVGDPKQSIYGWRSADLAAYEAFVEEVERAGGTLARLAVNHRSVPEVLEEVERAVAPVMRREPRVQPTFQPLVASPGKRFPALPEGLRAVEYWVSTAWDAEARAPRRTLAAEAAELEARALARELRSLHDAGHVAWKEIGVLFRSRGDLDVYLQALREAGIPYAVEGDRSYFQRREIIEAAALFRAVAEPNDHLALLAALRSPLAGVPDAALLPLWRAGLPPRAGRLVAPCPAELAELRGLGAEVARGLPGGVPGIERVAGWHEGLAALLAAIARLRRSLRDDPADVFVERLRSLTLLEATEGARTLGPWRVANLDRFFRELAESLAGEGGVPGCLRALRRAVAAEQRREESRPREAAEDAVQVATIHGAKGLDFRHVYVMQLHKRPGGDRSERVGAGRPRAGGPLEYRLLEAPTPGYDLVAGERERAAGAERVRTLYVAMTRAEERLVLAGQWPTARHDLGGAGPLDPRGRAAPRAATRGRAASPAATGADGKASLADLLARRRDLPAHPEELLAELAAAGGADRSDVVGGADRIDAGRAVDRIDAGGVRWVFPALAPAPAQAHAGARRHAPGLPTPEEVARASRSLAEARIAARARAARPFATTASAAVGEEDLEELAERRFGETAQRAAPAGEAPARGAGALGRAAKPVGRDAAEAAGERAAEAAVARAVGVAIHRTLEELDLAAAPAASLERARARLEALVRGAAEPGAFDEALRRSCGLLERIASGSLLARLRALAEGVLYRELPVILPPADAEGAAEGDLAAKGERAAEGEGAVGCTVGVVDLVYRDPERGELVVVDYKTDCVEGEAELHERAERYAPQGAVYQRALREALELAYTPRFELWFLDADRVVARP